MKVKKNRVFRPAAIAIALVLAVVFYALISHFMENYRVEIYDHVIGSNISALEETTGTLISKTTDGFEHCQHEVRMLGVGISESLKAQGFSAAEELSWDDRAYLQAFQRASVFDYSVLLGDSGRGVYTDGENLYPINLYSSQAYVDCLSSPTGEAISFISDPLSATSRDVVAFSSRAGALLLIGIYSQDSFETLYDSATFGENAAYLIVTQTGLILSGAHMVPQVREAVNLFTYLEQDPRNAAFFAPGAQQPSGHERVLADFQAGRGGRAELYFEGARYETVYAPIPHTDWNFVSCVSYDYITSDAAQINQKTIQLTFFIIALLLGMFLIIAAMLAFVLRARAARESVRRDRVFTLMTHYVPNVIVIADSQTGGIEYTSRNTVKVLGLPDAFSNVVDEQVLQCVHPADRQAFLDLIGKVRTGRSASERLKLRFTRPDTGAEIILSLDAYLIAEEDSAQRFITLTLEDITGSERARERLEQALASEERANAAKTTFLASMSHDIRTPLNAVIGLTTLALHCPEDSKRVSECLEKIANSSQLLLGLINDVLDMSKIESGKMQLSQTEFELGEWLDGVITVTQSQTSVRAQRFEVYARDVTHEQLLGDTVRLGQVLTNVLGNAVKFTPEGGDIRLELAELPSGDPELACFRFTVSDTGIGMSRSYMDHIFEMFSREQGSGAQAVQGTGLGMAITKRIVDLMGGSIGVQSTPGSGTVFTVELPVRLSPRPAPTLPGRRALVLGTPDAPRWDEAVRKLQELGMQTGYSAGYASAPALSRQARDQGLPFSLVLLPYELVRQDPALTRTRLARELGGDIRVLLGLRPGEYEARERAQELGFTDTISLPLFKSALYRSIAALLGEGSQAREGFDGSLDGLRILLVEDNALNREIAVEMLHSLMGARVDTARDGQEGCARFASAPENTYDLILMDLQMPVLGGLEAARRIRSGTHPQARDIPIIALTANAFEEDRQEALAAGMDGFVSKPIDLSELGREIFRVRRLL